MGAETPGIGPEDIEGDDIEVESTESSVRDYFELSREEREDLSKEIEGSDGVVVFAVHPFYDEYTQGEINPYKQRQNKRNARVLERLLQRDSRPPVIVFEEIGNLEETRDRLAGLMEESKGSVYLCATATDQMVPIKDIDQDIPPSGYLDMRSMKKITDAWKRFLKSLDGLNIKRVIVGGTNLRLNNSVPDMERLQVASYQSNRSRKGALNTEYRPSACVGQALLWLSGEYDVDISNFTAPFNRQDVERLEAEGEIAFDHYMERVVGEIIDAIESGHLDIRSEEFGEYIDDISERMWNVSERREENSIDAMTWYKYWQARLWRDLVELRPEFLRYYQANLSELLTIIYCADVKDDLKDLIIENIDEIGEKDFED